MDQITHLTAAIVFVGSLTAGVLLAVKAANDALDALAYRRAVRRRLRTFMARPVR